MYPSFLVKMFELHTKSFHSFMNILSIRLCLSFSDPEMVKRVVILHDVEHVNNNSRYQILLPLQDQTTTSKGCS